MTLRRLRLLAAVLALVAVPATAVAQQPGSLEEARDRLEQLQDQKADARTRLEAARDELEALQPRLDRSSRVLEEAEAEADAARLAAEEARREVERVEEELAAAKQRLAENQEELAQFARDAYKYGPGAGAPLLQALDQLAETSDPNAMSDILSMTESLLGDRALLVEESVQLIGQTKTLSEKAEATRRIRAQEAEKARAAEDRAAQRHAEMMDLLARADQAVAAQRQALAEIRAQQQDTEQRIDEIEEARERAMAAIGGVQDLGGGLVTVGGITVSASIGQQLEDLLVAAAADGINLGGHGYRSPETTAALRRANGCPDVYSSPASACRVPTARPGTSMHEKGLAVDFTWQGQTICYPNSPSRCSGNAAFDWLRANASRYGFHVLDSEAWHWSTNGN